MEQVIAVSYALRFMLAGRSVFNVINLNTKNQFRYRVYRSKRKNAWYVSTQIGHEWVYFGSIYSSGFYYSNKSKLYETDVAIVAFRWLYTKLSQNVSIPESVQIVSSSFCARCGRELKVIESIKRGVGPECYKKVYGS